MKLAGYKIRVFVARQLYDFDEFPVRRHPAKDHAFVLEGAAEFRVEFVSVTVAFADLLRTAVNLACKGVRLQTASPLAKAHCPTQLIHANKIAQLENDRERCLFVELGRVGVAQSALVAGKLDT